MARDASEPPDPGRSAADDYYAPPRAHEGASPVPVAPAAGPDPEGGENARRGLPWTLSTYFAEGLPFSLVHQVSAELFTAFGASLAAVSYTSFYGLAWNFKFTWSPLVERYGSLRRWIIATEILIAVVLAAVASRAGRGDLTSVALALVFVSILGATQDVAVDGYYIATLDKSAQATLSGPRVGAYRVALLVGKSGLVALAGFTSWKICFLAAAFLMASLGLFHRFALRPGRGPSPAAASPPARDLGQSLPRGAAGTVSAFAGSFGTFLAKPRIAPTLAFILAFKAGDALLFNMSAPFLKSLGLDTDMRGLLSTPSLIASVAGTIVGGIVIRRLSLARTLAPIAFLQCLAIPLYSVLAALRPSFAVIAVAVSFEQLIAGLGNAALIVFLMRRAEGPHKTAHFAICTALMSVPTTLAGLVSGHLAESLGFASFFLFAFIVAVPGAVLARHVPTD